MMKKLKSQNGSSFVYVLVVIMILTILSGTIITMTVANYKLGLTKGGRNTAFYFADGAIDEALAEIEEISHRAEIAASTEIQSDTADFRTSSEWIEFEKWLETHQISDETAVAEEASDEFLTSEEASELYSDALNKEFVKQYLLNLFENGAVDNDYILIDDGDNFVASNDVTFTYDADKVLNSAYLTALQTVVFDPEGTEGFNDIEDLLVNVSAEYRDADKAIRLTLQSSGKFNIYNKRVEVVVDMVPPHYDYVTMTSVKSKTLYTNDILENALTAKKDVVCVGGEVKTQGDVYALGTFREGLDVTYAEKGGVVIGYDKNNNDFLDLTNTLSLNETIHGSGALNVMGNVKTAASIKPSGAYSTLTVSNAVHGDSFIVAESATDTTTTIADSVFLMDDLYVAADDTTIMIGEDGFTAGNANLDESFISYLDGVDTLNSNKKLNNPDLSSSIRVDKNAENVDITLDALYVPGVAYINVYRDTLDADGNTERKFYQTGESFTTGNNFFFYQEKIEDQEERTQEVVYTNGTDEFALIEYVDDAGNISDSARYKAEHFLNRVLAEYSKEASVRDDEIVSTTDKTIMTIRSMVRTIADGDDDTGQYDDNFALGVFLGNGRIYNPNGLAMGSDNFIDSVKLSSNLISDLYMYLLGYRDYRTGKLVTVLDDTDPDSEMMDQYIDFSKASEFTDVNAPGRLIVLNDSEDGDVYINVPALHIPSNPDAVVYDGPKTIQGLVATKGDIYVYNDGSEDLVFNGALIAGGDIIFYGDGKKQINNFDSSLAATALAKGTSIPSHALVYKFVGSSSVLTEAFHVLDDAAVTDDGGRKLIAEKLSGTSNYTRSIHFNLDLDIVNKDFDYADDQPSVAKVDVSMSSTPELDGSSKSKEIRGYELVYWREL
ncbi:MAG: hypothetical protein JXO44_07170 [Clostridia bacterium]|nr:hypothetical protein [Clostridia bacterium]